MANGNIFPIDRVFNVTPTNNGDYAEFGPGGIASQVGTVAFTFAPSIDFVGTFVVYARPQGDEAQKAGAPFLAVPYVRVNVAGAASDRAISSATITTAGKIEVPSNGDSIALLIGCSAGSCVIFPVRVAGSGAR